MVTIRQFSDMSEALLAQGCLRSAGIESFLADLNMSRVDWPLTRGMRLQVGEEDAEAAVALLEGSALEDPGD
jgi:Putative prokaryotic signal transducing protein